MKNVTLEMSLKPFKKTDDNYIKQVCTKIFEQWRPLVEAFDSISVMLWCADGSEILDYRQNKHDSFEWSYYAGNANPEHTVWHTDHDPDGVSVYAEGFLYTNDIPVMTYEILRKIVTFIKEIGTNITGKKVTVGATFDIGPEFAKSNFKYVRHREICSGNDFGAKTMVCCYETLNADNISYAGFPDGIKQGTPFGTFFGRQCNIFLSDMGMDFIWFSNGLGFGRDTWSVTGAIFDGEKFHINELESVKDSVINFWELFRKECPDYEIRVRGTNMTVGIDLSTDGVPIKTIYEKVNNIIPPPNSPWAALDGDFGLELTGYMSRMAELPGTDYMFRYYLHDPWWVNTPWYDRYEGQPHDIYLPLATGRLDDKGKMYKPSHVHFLSIDNSWGDLPDICANEVIPHVLKALKNAPDSPSPVVWVYPFDEYSNAYNEKQLNNMYHHDWFIRGCINNGAPISCIISTKNFIKSDKNIFKGSIIVTAVPEKETNFEKQIIKYCIDGGKVIFFGGIDTASDSFMTLAGLKKTDGISGELEISVDGKASGIIKHEEMINAGKINTVASGSNAFALIGKRTIGVKKESCIWLRGTASINRINYSEQGRLPVQHDDSQYFIGERLMLTALAKFGLELCYEKPLSEKMPVTMISRSDNGFFYSVYTPSTTVKTTIKHPLGAPLLLGYQTIIEDGKASYHFPKAEHRECRVFVEQSDGIVGASECPPISYTIRRQIKVTGLKNATIRFFPEDYCKNTSSAVLNSFGCCITSEKFDLKTITDEYGTYLEARKVSGTIIFQMPDVKHNGKIKQPERKRGAHCKTGDTYDHKIVYF